MLQKVLAGLQHGVPSAAQALYQMAPGGLPLGNEHWMLAAAALAAHSGQQGAGQLGSLPQSSALAANGLFGGGFPAPQLQVFHISLRSVAWAFNNPPWIMPLLN